jgi:hypothetical protein
MAVWWAAVSLRRSSAVSSPLASAVDTHSATTRADGSKPTQLVLMNRGASGSSCPRPAELL